MGVPYTDGRRTNSRTADPPRRPATVPVALGRNLVYKSGPGRAGPSSNGAARVDEASVVGTDSGTDSDPPRAIDGAGVDGVRSQPPAADPAGAGSAVGPTGVRADRREGWLTGGAAVVLAALFLLASVGRSGIWDPHELVRADLARRIAVQLFGAASLAVPGAPAALPTLGDLGMGELPFTSMALGFQLFGLHDWAGRLPLALWAFGGALLLYGLLRRLVSPRAGLYGAVVLCTMPLYFMQARTMLGDVVTMVAYIACFGGLLGSMLDDRAEGRLGRAAGLTGWLAIGLGGAVAGYLSRGLIVGVAAPALGVGLAWLCIVGAGGPPPSPRRRVAFHGIGIAALLLGAAALVYGVDVLWELGFGRHPVLRAIGFTVLTKPPVESTFELTARDIGHALFPWSAFLPFAVGRLLRLPRGTAAASESQRREAYLRTALLVGGACAYGAFALVAPYAGALPFSAVGALAAIAALALVDFERGESPSPVVAGGTALGTLVLWRDMVHLPDKPLSVFGALEQSLPKGAETAGSDAMMAAALLFAGIAFLAWLERSFERQPAGWFAWVAERARAYQRAGQTIAALWKGNLLFGLLVVEAAAAGLGAMLFVGKRIGWAAVERFPHNVALLGLNAWWALPLVLIGLVLGVDLARGLFALLLRWTRLPRAAATLVGALAAGGLLCFGYYPALAAQLSPKEVFQRYAALHAPGEPLGVLGVRPRAAEFYAGGEHVESLAGTRAALRWLTESGPSPRAGRRWLVLRSTDLPELNSEFRERTHRNLPVIDAESGTTLLASNELGGASNQNWLDAFIKDQPGPIQHPVSAVFGDELEALGWDVVDDAGQPVAVVVPQRSYTMHFYYRVLRRMSHNYQAFLHIDGQHRRHNGDHEVLDGQYRLGLWNPGDVIVDSFPLELEPNFTPGDYTVYYGFFQGSQRFEVTRGKHQDNRVDGGVLHVR